MAGITPTEVLRYINRNIGASLQELELNEHEIMRVVFQQTIPTFSRYYPYIFNLNLTEKDLVENNISNYRLPVIEGVRIFGIHRIFVSNVAYYGNTLVNTNFNPLASQIMEDGISMVTTPVTWDFEEPNIVKIYPKVIGNSPILVEVKAEHPAHMKTIDIGMREEFMKLALLDVLVSLYPLRKRFSSLSTPFGSIELFLDQVDAAPSARDEFLENLREKMLYSANAKRVWIS